ncbi:MAG TPA: hypothetical protein VF518_14095, partial [Polyangia bacterium]
MLRFLSLSRVLRALAFAASVSMFLFSLWLVWLAFNVPAELEIREGTEWIHILAKNAGVDIYSTKHVAFVNMNHGPMDAILKAWLARAIPSLPGWMVTRSFVLLLPTFLLGSAYVVCRKNWTYALLAAATLHLFLVSLTNMTLVGRSDATALCGLAVCAALTHQILANQRPERSPRRALLQQTLLGVMSAVVFLSCWRLLPVLASVQFVILLRQLAAPRGSRVRGALSAVGLFLVGFALVWVPTFFLELHGYVHVYYKRFFGFFSAASGWGTFPGSRFRLFPRELLTTRHGVMLLLMVALTLLGIYRLRRERGELIAWLLVLPANWVLHAYMFYKNQGGGGFHYFSPFFLLTWLFILHALGTQTSARSSLLVWLAACFLPARGLLSRWQQLVRLQSHTRLLIPLVLAGLIVGLLPWRSLLDEGRNLSRLRPAATAFFEEVKARSDGEAVFSEGMHLFKTKYRNEIVDTGDTASVIARSKYFGEVFLHTFERYVARLQTDPPGFVVAGLLVEQGLTGTQSPELVQLLSEHYTITLRSPDVFVANG